jgi:hypothetical protein
MWSKMRVSRAKLEMTAFLHGLVLYICILDGGQHSHTEYASTSIESRQAKQ